MYNKNKNNKKKKKKKIIKKKKRKKNDIKYFINVKKKTFLSLKFYIHIYF